jgi:uncharacterized membrane protein YeaQ/YmgE (transglycosylase-associated protein family)
VSLLGLFILILIAAVTGSIGQAIAGYSVGGCLVSAVVGFIGAFLGLWISRELGLPAPWTITVDGEPFPVLWSIIGSALFTAVLGLIGGRRRAA